jgi:hypothetical protein
LTHKKKERRWCWLEEKKEKKERKDGPYSLCVAGYAKEKRRKRRKVRELISEKIKGVWQQV